MPKTLTDQSRMFPPLTDDPSQFGDGSGMHSRIPYDLVPMLNNLQSYCEPSFQFVFDVNYNPTGSVGSGNARCQHSRPTSTYAESGTAMLGQFPILVPLQARYLCYSFGFYRFPSADEVPISVGVTGINFYLASRPVTRLSAPGTIPVTSVDNSESGRLFSPSYISGSYTTNDHGGLPASSVDSLTFYTRIESTTWVDWDNKNNINDRINNPWAFLIVTCDFATMNVAERIQAAELSVWFEYFPQ